MTKRFRQVASATVAAFAVLFVSGCATTTARPAEFPAEELAAIDSAVEQAIAEKRVPGAVFHLERHGHIYEKTWGHRALVPTEELMTTSTIFDAASITKVMATTPSIWLLIERGRIGLDDRASRFLPEFTGGLRDEITIRHLLTHTSGLRPDVDLEPLWSGAGTGIELALAETPKQKPGYVFRYSDINFILLGEIVKRVSGMALDDFAAREIFGPLKMTDTRFIRCDPSTGEGSPCTPDPAIPPTTLARIAPTQWAGTVMLRGVVHDPTSRRMGGVAGHAGLFTTAHDLARYARMLLGRGVLDGARVLRPETVDAMTSVQSPPDVAVRRTGGFDLDSGYSRPRGELFPIGSFGHTGFTGGFFWIDPASQTFYVFMSNRVHPDGSGSVTLLQRNIGTLAAAAAGLTATPDPCTQATPDAVAVGLKSRCPRINFILGGADAVDGVDVLAGSGYRVLQGLRVGLITNHTGVDRSGNPTIDLLRSAPGVTLTALFSPEHGIRGAADENVGDSVDPVSRLPVYSLYGDRRSPSPAQLDNLDALVFDIQDVGARFYTYISTLGLSMEAAAAAHKKFVVLDRVNPIGGDLVEGPLAQGEPTFVAFHTIPVRHGMTVGEFARLYAAEKKLDLALEVVKVRGWKRDMWLDEAGLPWINTSPNMRGLTAAGLYPGLGLLESAISVGRGTPTPFEIVGAPYIDGNVLARELTALQLSGVAFAPIRFTPVTSLFAAQECGGVRLTLTDRRTFRPVRTGVAIALTLRRLYGDQFAVDKMGRLLENPAVLDAIRSGRSLTDVESLWKDDEKAFLGRREKALLY